VLSQFGNLTYSGFMSQPKILLVLNPTAGKGRAGRRRSEIEAALAKRGLDFETRLTEGAWHAAELAQAAGRQGFGAILAAGGDGTLNEVLNGLMLAKEAGSPLPTLGVLPVGRANDFAFGTGIPRDLAGAVDLIADGSKEGIDVGFVKGGDYPRGRFFGNGLGVGFDALVNFAATRLRNLHGPLAYTIGALRIFALFPLPVAVRITSEDFRWEGDCQQVSVMNGRRMGGAYFMAPEALVHDGLFDICVVEDSTRYEMAELILRYAKGTQIGHPRVTMGRASRIYLDAPLGGLAVHADGETICERGRSIEIECRAGALEAFIPRRPEKAGK